MLYEVITAMLDVAQEVGRLEKKETASLIELVVLQLVAELLVVRETPQHQSGMAFVIHMQ